MKEQTIIIKYKCKETHRMLPDLYIKSLEDAIAANSEDFDTLEEIRVKLINARAEVDKHQARIWADKNGYGKPVNRENV